MILRLLTTAVLMVSCCYADTIESAMMDAYKNNTDIKAKITALRAANEREVQAKAGFRPVLLLNTSVTRSDVNDSGTYNDTSRELNIATGAVSKTGGTTNEFSATVSQNLYQGGNTIYSIEGAQATIKAARADLSATVQLVMFNAVSAYLDLQTAIENLRYLGENEKTLKQSYDSSKDKFNAGEENLTSVSQAYSRYADGLAKRLAADGDVEGKKATYEKIVGKKPGVLAKPSIPKNMPLQLLSAIDKAMVMNPIIAQTIYTEIASRREIDKYNAGLLPKVDLQASSVRQENLISTKYTTHAPLNSTFDPLLKERKNNTNNKINVSVSWTLYDGGTLRSQKRQAAHTAEGNRIAIESQRRTIKEAIIQAWELFVANKDAVETRRGQVKGYEVALAGTQQEFQVGTKILLDVLNAQLDLVTAQQALVTSENTYYKAAYQIVQLIGALTPKEMKLDVEMYDPLRQYEEVRNKF